LAIKLTGANCHDSTQALLLRIPSLQGPRGRPRCRPDSLLGDRAYDAEYIRYALHARKILPSLAISNTKHGSGLGRGAGLRNALSHGSIIFAACACGMKKGQTCTWHF